MKVNFNKNVKDWSYEERLRNAVVFATVCIGGLFFYIASWHC